MTAELTPDQRALVESHQAFAVWVVGRHFPRLRGVNREDAHAAAFLGLVLAAQRFEPERGNKFGTYAERWVRQCVSRQYDNDRRRGMRQCQPGAVLVASLDTERAGGATLAELVADHRGDVAPVDAALDVRAVLAPLPVREREVLVALYLDGDSSRDVAGRLGVTARRVGQLEARAVGRLRERAT